MIYVFLLGSMLFAMGTAPKSSNVRTEPVTSGTETFVTITTAPQYKVDTLEYKIQQIALNIEAVLPSKIINPDYKDAYLDTAGVPKEMRNNFMSRNALYNDVIKLKIMDRTKEGSNGFLETTSTSAPEDAIKIKAENDLRKELFSLIVKNLNLKTDKDSSKVPVIYAEAIKYLKDYSLSIQNQPPIQKKDTKVIASITSIYKYDAVWEALLKVLREQNYITDKNTMDRAKGQIEVKYKCGEEERIFLIRLCALKENKLYNCKDARDNEPYAPAPEGVVVWVENGKDKDKSLIVTEDSLGDQNVKLCKDDSRIFNVLEKVSGLLIEADKPKKNKD